MKRIAPLFLLLLVSIIHISYAQQGELMVYPETHFTDIMAMDVSDDGNNLLTKDLNGRMILWDLELKKPLRIWNINGVPLFSVIALQDQVAFVLYTTASVAEMENNSTAPVKIKMLNLTDGKSQDLAIDELQCSDMSLGPQLDRGQDIALLAGDEVVCVDLYRREVRWRTAIPADTYDEVNFLSDGVIAISIEGEGTKSSKFFDVKTGSAVSAEPNLPPDFDLLNYWSDHLVGQSTDSITFHNIRDGYVIKFFGEGKVEMDGIQDIVSNENFAAFYYEMDDNHSIVFVDNIEHRILWKKEVEQVHDFIFDHKNFNVVYSDSRRKINVLSGDDGIVEQEISNVREDNKRLYLSEDLSKMMYFQFATGDDGEEISKDAKTSFFNIESKAKAQRLFDFPATQGSYYDDSKSFVGLFADGVIWDYDFMSHEKKVVDFPTEHLGDEFKHKNNMYVHSASKNILVNSSNQQLLVSTNDDPLLTGFVQSEVVMSMMPVSYINVLYNLETESIVTTIDFEGRDIDGIISENGKYIKFVDGTPGEQQALIYSISQKQFLNPAWREGGKFLNIVFSNSDDRVLLQDDLQNWYIADGDMKLTRKLEKHGISTFVQFVPNEGKLFYRLYQDSDITFLQYDDPRRVVTTKLQGIDKALGIKEISHNGRYISLNSQSLMQVLDLQEMKFVVEEKNVNEPVTDIVVFSKDDKFMFSSKPDGRLKIWDLKKAKLSATFIITPTGEWAVYTPEGLFDGSPTALKEMYYVVRKEVVALEQLKDKYWKPGLLKLILDEEMEKVTSVANLTDLPLYPQASLSTSALQDSLYISYAESQGGSGDVSVFINEVMQDQHVESRSEVKTQFIGENTVLAVPLSIYEDNLLMDRANIIGVVMHNQDNSLKSRMEKIPVEYKVAKHDNASVRSRGARDKVKKTQKSMLDPTKTRLIALIVGTSDYADDKLDLNYADTDANSIELALRESGGDLFKKEKVIIHKLVSKSSDSDSKSYRKNILDEMEKIKKEVKPDDILFIFFSGHGVSKKSEYYYLTKEATNAAIAGTDEALGSCTISASEIKKFIQGTKSLRKVLMLDACYSGQFAESFSARSTGDQKKAMDDLKDKTGMYVLSSSTSDQESFETDEEEQGLLTHGIMDGMSGNARTKNNTIYIEDLIDYTIEKVGLLAEEKGLNQQPTLFVPEASLSFPIGNPMSSLAPKTDYTFIQPAALLDQSVMTVAKDLNILIDKEVKTVAADKSKKMKATSKTRKNAIVIRGLYDKATNKATIHLICNEQNFASVTIEKSSAQELAAAIVAALEKEIPKAEAYRL